jgi:hypothetical protein
MNAPTDLSMKTDDVLRVELEVFKREHRDLDDAIHALVEKGTGDQLTLADIHVRYVLSVVGVGAQLLERDIAGEIDGLEAWTERMAEDPVSKRVDADREANREDFFAYIRSLA